MTSLARRALGKLVREQQAARDLIGAWFRDGYESAAHLRRERAAFRAAAWGEFRPHFRARVNLRGQRPGKGATGEVFGALAIRDVDELSFALFDAHTDATIAAVRRMPVVELTDFYNYVRFFGDFRVANILRLELLELYARRLGSGRSLTRDVIAAALELGRAADVLAAARATPPAWRDRESVSEGLALAHALTGARPAADALWRERYRDSDAEFRAMMAGRSVAVVGPAPPNADVGSEIDTHDVVVRTNYRVGSNHPESWYGSRTDVTYYNHMRMTYNKDEVVAATELVKWVVLKNREDEIKLRGWLPTLRAGARYAFAAGPVFFKDAAPMAIPNVLNDIIRFSPARVKLFCTTFHSSAQTYHTTYRTKPIDDAVISASLRLHEPFGGFTFVQHLRQAELCDVDGATDSVLRLSRDEYAQGLNVKYGDIPLR